MLDPDLGGIMMVATCAGERVAISAQEPQINSLKLLFDEILFESNGTIGAREIIG